MAGVPDEAGYRERDQQGDADAAFELGNLLARRGELEEAEAAYARADERGHGTGAANLGLLLEHRGELKGAEDAYRRADERGDGVGALRLGLLVGNQGNWDQAEAAFVRAQERGSADGQFDLAAALGRREGLERRHLQRPAFANPVLIGAVTLLVVLVAVFLAFIANRGLPFVPTRELKVDIANGSNLVPGNDVLEGGHRVGLLYSMKPVRLQDGSIGAQLVLKLSPSDGKVPVDSQVSVRLRTFLGEKFVELIKGSSSQIIPDGGTLPVSQTNVPVQIDEVFNIFNPPTRRAVQQDLQGFGDAFTARGNDLNLTIQSLPSLLGHLRPVAAYLSAPSTELTRFFNSLEAVTGALAPASNQTADLFRDAATTFQAITSSPQSYEATIAQSPATLATSTDSLRAQQPLYTDLTNFGRYFSPATTSLKATLPSLNPALEAGAVTLKQAPTLNAGLQKVMSSLKSLAEDPMTNVALNGLEATVGTLNPMLRYLGPYQTVCDDFNYFFSYLQDNVSEQSAYGTGQRILVKVGNPLQPNNEGAAGANVPVNGGGSDNILTGGNETYHQQNYGAAIDNQGNADCETGQRGYPLRLNHFDPQHRNFAIDQHTPGDQGPTFHGLSRVPPGETFTRNPTTGPQTPYNPSNP
jgi:phospholipid/cholesterol/gamma-HCH transport system substrate-binding protein